MIARIPVGFRFASQDLGDSALTDAVNANTPEHTGIAERAEYLQKLEFQCIFQIADLGSAVWLDPSSKANDKHNTYFTTIWYRAPELLLGEVQPELAADVWSSGVSIWELGIGDPPFRGHSKWDQFRQILEKKGPAP